MMCVCCTQRRIDTLLREKLTGLVDMLDWISQAEQGLGSEQPQSDQSTLLSDQLDTHKVRNNQHLTTILPKKIVLLSL